MSASQAHRPAPPSLWSAAAATLLVLSVALAFIWPGAERGLALPPLLSGEPDSPAAVQAALGSANNAQQAFLAAQDALHNTALGATGQPYDATTDLDVMAAGGPGAAAALVNASTYAIALSRLAVTSTSYQAALQGYDDALMARSRSLGPKVEQLRSDTWPFVEYVKQFPPPLGLDTTLHPTSATDLAAIAQRLGSAAHAPTLTADQRASAMRDLRQLSAGSGPTLRIAGLLPHYQELLQTYSGQVDQVAAAPDTAPGGLRARFGTLGAALLFAVFALGALGVLLSGRRLLSEQDVLPLLAVALAGAGYFITPQVPAVLAWIGFFLIALRSPSAALVGVAAMVPFFFHPRAVLRWHFSPAELALLTTAGAVAVRLISGDQETLRSDFRHVSPLDVLAALFLVAATLSLLVPKGDQLHIALRSYRVVIGEPVLFYVLLTRLVFNEPRLRWALDALIVALAAIGWLATAQFVTGTDTWSSGGVARALGVEPGATALGIELGRGVTLALVLALLHPSVRARAAYLALAIPGGAGLLVSFTRGAWIATGSALAGVALLTRRWRLLLGLAIVAVAGAAVIATSSLERLKGLFNLQSGSSAARLDIWHGTLLMLRDHPLMGIGLDQFLAQHPESYGIPELRFFIISHPHNVLLDAWLQLGLLGMLVSAGIVVTAIFTSWRIARTALTPLTRAWGWALLAALVEFCVHGMVDEGYFTGDLAMTFWLLIGAVEVLHREHLAHAKERPAMPARPGTAPPELVALSRAYAQRAPGPG